MRIQTLLVTGAAGFIGSGFVERATKQSYRVVILDALTYAGHRENLDNLPVSTRPSWELIHGDIGDAALVSSLLSEHRPVSVLNFAAESHVDRSIHGPSSFIATNITGTFNLLQCSLNYWKRLSPAEQSDFRYLQISTDEVYGSLGPTGKFSEKTPFAPNSPYSASKASADFLVRAWHHTYGLPTLTTHCSNNYGPRQFPEKLIPLMIHSAVNDLPLPVYGDGANIRDWIHVEDHCAGVLLALEKGRAGETYCFGGDSERANLEVVREICLILDRLRPRKDEKSYSDLITFVTDRLGHDRRYAIDHEKARNELGFAPHHSFSEGLESTVKWYLENTTWAKSVLKSSKERIA